MRRRNIGKRERKTEKREGIIDGAHYLKTRRGCDTWSKEKGKQ